MKSETVIITGCSLEECTQAAAGKRIIGAPAVNREWVTRYGTTKKRDVFYLPVAK